MSYPRSTVSRLPSILMLIGSSGLKGKALSSTKAFSKYMVWREPTLSILVVVWFTIALTLVRTVFNTIVDSPVRKYLYTHYGIENGAHHHEYHEHGRWTQDEGLGYSRSGRDHRKNRLSNLQGKVADGKRLVSGHSH